MNNQSKPDLKKEEQRKPNNNNNNMATISVGGKIMRTSSSNRNNKRGIIRSAIGALGGMLMSVTGQPISVLVMVKQVISKGIARRRTMQVRHSWGQSMPRMQDVTTWSKV